MLSMGHPPSDPAAADLLRVAEQIFDPDSSERDLEGVLRRSVERARTLAGAASAELGLLDARQELVRMLWSTGERRYAVRPGQDLLGKVVAEGKTHRVADYSAWPDRSVPAAGALAAVGVPLTYRGTVIGGLAVFSDDPQRVFTDLEVRLLELLAGQASIEIRNAHLFQELSERVQAQKAAEGKMVEAARLAAIGEMAAGIAHELNNPLTAIAGFSELLRDEFPPESRQREHMELILREARRSREIVRRLLDFSRREAAHQAPVDITEAVSEVLALVQPMAQVQQVEIHFEAWEELPLVLGDRGRLRQVILNLVHNGIQAMPDGGPLLIQTAVEAGPPERIAIRVRDAGAGIPEEHRSRIFEPFFTTKPLGSGTGLGLSISSTIVAEHGGEIRVDSTPGAGACFTVLLPVFQEGSGPR